MSLVRPWLDSDRALERYLGIAVCSVHRADPYERLARLIEDREPPSGRERSGSWVNWAVWICPSTCARHRYRRGRYGSVLGHVVAGAGHGLASRRHRAAADSAGFVPGGPRRSQPRTAHARARRFQGLAQSPQWRSCPSPSGCCWTWGTWRSGGRRPAIDRVSDPLLARVAGESLSMITGLDIGYEELSGEAPEGVAAGPADDLLDAGVTPDPDEGLPWPDPPKVDAWWASEGHRFATGCRYLLGAPVAPDTCEHAWTEGFQRQRSAAAHELAISRPGTRLRNCAARYLK